jgi:hypothetical protein
MKQIFKPATFLALAPPGTDDELEFNDRILKFMTTKMLDFNNKQIAIYP